MTAWLQHAPLLAIDPGAVFTAVFLIVMFLGWLMQMVGGQNQQPPAQQPRRRPQPPGEGGPRGPQRRPARNDRIASEIDAFLKEVGARNEEPPIEDVEIVSPPKRPPAERRRQARPPQPPRSPREEPTPVRTEFGETVRSHVSTYMTERVGEEARDHLRHAEPAPELPIESRRAALEAAAVVRTAPQHPIVALLRRPEGAQQAVLLSEILARPRSLRD